MLGWVKRLFRGGIDADEAPPRVNEPARAVMTLVPPTSEGDASGSEVPKRVSRTPTMRLDESLDLPWAWLVTGRSVDRPDRHLRPEEVERVEPLVEAVMRQFELERPEPESFPALAAQVIDLCEHPSVDAPRLSRLIEQDPAITAKVLRTANSALYGRDIEVQSVRAAITHLGLEQVANIAVGMAGRSLFDLEARAGYQLFARHWDKLFHHAMTTAFASGWCALERGGRSNRAFLGGMFHDVGKSVALRAVTKLCTDGGPGFEERPSDLLIETVLERVHVHIGDEVHATWSLPQFLRDICRQHHDRDLPLPASADDVALSLHVVRVVSGLNMVRVDAASLGGVDPEIRESATALDMNREALRSVAGRIDDFAVRTSEIFGIADRRRGITGNLDPVSV